jgi:hypothetical protein
MNSVRLNVNNVIQAIDAARGSAKSDKHNDCRQQVFNLKQMLVEE